MQVLYERCARLDVHKKTVVAGLLLVLSTGDLRKEVRTFSTTTAGLLGLADWLNEHRVTHVAMESTGIYWRPIFNILEESVTVLLVNAQHMKAVPRDARPMSRIVSGSPNSYGMDCCKAVSSLNPLCVSS